MKVLVLAAGRSKRMKPVEDKNFLNFLGQSLISWQLNFLWEAGFKEIILVGGKHNLERLKALDSSLPIQIDVVEQGNLEEGMKGAVLACEKLIDGEPVLIFSSNDVVSKEAFEIMKNAILNNEEEKNHSDEHDVADGFMLAKKVDSYFPGGYLELDENGNVSNIIEKPTPGEEPSDLVNLVVHYFKNSKKLIETLKTVESKKDDLYEVAVDTMIKGGDKIKAIEYDGFWQALKYPWHAQNIFRYLLGISLNGKDMQISDTAKIAKNAIIDGNVVIDENAVIMDGAIVKGPAYIGRGTIVAMNSLVRDSNVGEKCVIGFSSEVARSYLGDNVWTHSNYIGDSLIGNDVSFGAGTVIGNLRLDEGIISVRDGENKISTDTNKFGIITGDHIRVGVNTSFMPGTKIGGGSYVGAGIVVAEDIPENSFVKGDWKLKISKNESGFSEEMRELMRKKL